MKPPIAQRYADDREACDTGEERRQVWRTYALAVLEEYQRPSRGLLHPIDVRRSPGDDALPRPFAPFWAAIPDDHLRDLWLALERARYRAEDGDDA